MLDKQRLEPNNDGVGLLNHSHCDYQASIIIRQRVRWNRGHGLPHVGWGWYCVGRRRLVAFGL